jgi:beta-glucosidase
MIARVSRRSFARLLGLSVSAAALPGSGATTSTPVPCASPTPSAIGDGFPKGFLWGTATSAYQIEGAPDAEGRGPSIWDTFSHVKKNTYTGDNGDVADDEFHRYREDIAIMRELGVKAYQFSVSWPRIFPAGTGASNPQGWDFYDRMLDALLEAEIEPFCTLYHWDLPEAMMTVGGWQSRDVAKAFADYSEAAARHLGDRVKNFITMSEVTTFVDEGYRWGSDAPGLKLPTGPVMQVTHNALLGHGLAVQAVRANTPAGTRVGIADNAVSTCPVIETPENIAAARTAYREENARVLTVILEGRYTELFLKGLGADAPKFTAEEMKVISSPLDFIGLNIYEPTWVRASATTASGYEVVDMPKSYPKMAAGWLQFGPGGMYWSPKLLHEVWGVEEIYITENGAASSDVLNKTGEVLDVDRVLFLRSYLSHLQRATTEGVPVKGYFLWSLMDNYEWSDGYPMRFGITYVDYTTQKRTVKLSGEFYKEVIARNGLA